MPIKDAQNFLALVHADSALRAQVEALEGRGILARIAILAEEHGCHFTVDEYREAVVLESQGQLSDESLGEVLKELGLENQKRNQV